MDQKQIILVTHTETVKLTICGSVGEMRDAEMNRGNVIKKGKKIKDRKGCKRDERVDRKQ